MGNVKRRERENKMISGGFVVLTWGNLNIPPEGIR